MLKFKIEDTECEIQDDYNISCYGSFSEEIKTIWSSFLDGGSPSLPCPIDSMCNAMEKLGAEIIKYDQESNPDFVY